MRPGHSSTTVVIADDDDDDRLLVRQALLTVQPQCEVRFVEDGEELLDYLRGQGRFDSPAGVPAPDLILLDLNMPRVDGLEALAAIKSDDALRHIPIIVLTTSRAGSDVLHAYRIGANSYIEKPAGFDELVEAMRGLLEYWLGLASLPGRSP